MGDATLPWKKYYDLGYEVRSSGGDGLQQWRACSRELSHVAKFYTPLHLRTLVPEYAGMDDAVTLTFAGTRFDNRVETDHFLVQHFRIPMQCGFHLSEKKLMQIAYNAGQFHAAREKGAYTRDVAAAYDQAKLGHLHTYLDAWCFQA